MKKYLAILVSSAALAAAAFGQTPTPTPTPPPPTTAPRIPIIGPVKDTRSPLVALSGKLAQSSKSGCISVTAQPDEAARLSATGSVSQPALRASKGKRPQKAQTFRLRPAKAVAARARQRVTLKLCLPKKALKAVKQGLKRGRRSTARVTILAVDAAGNKRTVKRQVRLT